MEKPRNVKPEIMKTYKDWLEKDVSVASRRRHTRYDCDWSSDVFFFQAEDGIRDLTVTGVQTCALPILEVFGNLRELELPGLDGVDRRRRFRLHVEPLPVLLAHHQQIGRASCRERV